MLSGVFSVLENVRVSPNADRKAGKTVRQVYKWKAPGSFGGDGVRQFMEICKEDFWKNEFCGSARQRCFNRIKREESPGGILFAAQDAESERTMRPTRSV